MQTTTLSIQVSSAGLEGAQRQQQANGDAGKFSASLSREMALRQNAAPMPAAIAPVQKPKVADKPAAASPPPAPREAARPANGAGDSKAAKAEGSGEQAASDEAESTDAAASTPMADMLALVASFNQLHGANADAAAGPAAALSAVPADQFAALQAARKPQRTDGADPALAGAALGAADATDGGSALVPQAALAAGDKAQAQQAAGFRAAQDAASAAAAAKAGPDPAGLSARQAREAVEASTLKEAAPLAPTVLQAQPAALEIAQAATGAATDRLAARVGTPAWNQQVGQKIVWMVAGEEQTASLTLNPPDLGPLQVVLSISNEQTSVAFSSNQLEVRQALENALPRLREMMGESGIALGNATVDAGMPDGREAQQQAGRGDGAAGRGGAGDAGGVDTGAVPVPRTRPLGDRGMVDTFA
jgi:flagellar hook-length control protein FliK